MKKTMTIMAIVLLVCVASVFALTACNIDDLAIEGEGSWDLDADTQNDCIEMLEDSFEKALKDPNFTVVAKVDGNDYFTEYVVGANSCTVHSADNKEYAVKDGNNYVMISETDTPCAYVDKDLYEDNYCFFMTFIVDTVKELEGGTFACSKHVEEKDRTANGETTIYDSNGTLSFTWTSEDNIYKIDTVEKNDLVQSATITMTENGETKTMTLTFTYGNTVVNVPDYTSWIVEDDTDGEEDGGDVVEDEGEEGGAVEDDE